MIAGATMLMTWVLAAAAEDPVAVRVEPELVRLGESALLVVAVYGPEAADSEIASLPAVFGLRMERAGSQTTTEARAGRAGAAGAPTLVTRFFYWVYPVATGTYNIPPVEVVVRGQKRVSTGSAILVVEPGSAGDAPRERFLVQVEPEEACFYHQPIFFRLEARVAEEVLDEARVSLPWLGSGSGLIVFPQVAGEGDGGSALYVIETGRREAFAVEAAGDGNLILTRTDAALPVRAGRLDLEPACLVVGGGGGERPAVAPRELPALDVVDLPDTGRPPAFTNAVGRFEVSFRVEPRRVRVGDAVTLRFGIEGRGNNEFVTMPDFPSLRGSFRVFAWRDGSEDRLGWPAYTRWRDFEIAPLDVAVEEVPPLEFAFFDPASGAYETVRWEGASIEVLPPAAGGAAEAAGGDETGEAGAAGEAPPLSGPLTAALLLGAVGAPAALLLWFAAREKRRRRAAQRRPRAEAAVALLEARLGALGVPAEVAAEEDAAAVARLLAECLGAMFEVRAAELLARAAERALVERGAPPALAAELEDFLARLDRLRFARGTEAGDLGDLRGEALRLARRFNPGYSRAP